MERSRSIWRRRSRSVMAMVSADAGWGGGRPLGRRTFTSSLCGADAGVKVAQGWRRMTGVDTIVGPRDPQCGCPFPRRTRPHRMRSISTLHISVVLLGLAGLAVPALRPARAEALRLPVWTPGSNVHAPCYRGDVLEVQLTAGAARAVLPRGAGPTRALPMGRLGLARVDAVAAAVGAVAFEPEFRGETPPAPGEGPDFTAFQLVHLAPGSDLATALERFRALPEVASADPIALLPVSALPNDSLATATYWLENPRNNRADIHAPEAWQVTMGDTSIVVGIIDTGVVPYHPDLGGRGGERGQMWVNWAEKGGLPGVDDDGNGFVDDTGG